MSDYIWDCPECKGKDCMISSHNFKGKPAGHCKCTQCSYSALACPHAEGQQGTPGIVGPNWEPLGQARRMLLNVLKNLGHNIDDIEIIQENY